ncbi:MAG: restriction endonuclease subunit S [Planctomycetota bacterium]
MADDAVLENKPLHLPSRFANLPPGWTWRRLDDACDGVFDCPHSTPCLVDAGPFVVRSQDIITGVFRTEKAARVSEETYKERTSRVVPARGDLLYSREGTYFGIAAEVPEQTRLCLGQRMVLIRPKPGVVDFRFLSRWLNSPIMASHIHGYRDGTVAERLNLPTIRALPVLLPPLLEQRAIAHILGTLDDKIELNRRMNETLEAMARALFKSWFVDFDPVRAKAEGRNPGLPQPIADLFPDSFEDSELGDIPRGWRKSTIGREAMTLLGGTPSRDEPSYWGGDIPWINSGKANEFRIVEPSEFITRKGLECSATKSLPLRTTVIAITGATLGQVSLTEIETCANQSVVGVIGSDTLPNEYVYFWVKENITPLIAGQTGGAQQHINKNNVNDLPLLCPTANAIASYLAVARPIFDRIKTCCLSTLSLAALRDALLPKLVSGQLHVKNSAAFLGGPA